jgi:hypothetical protein
MLKAVAHLAILVALTSWLPTACQRSAMLSGDVFVTMKSGDVKRGADVAVILVAATPEFDSEWNGLIAQFRKELRAADESATQSKSARDVAARQQATAFNAFLRGIGGGQRRIVSRTGRREQS